jgi:hypothetical protein
VCAAIHITLKLAVDLVGGTSWRASLTVPCTKAVGIGRHADPALVEFVATRCVARLQYKESTSAFILQVFNPSDTSMRFSVLSILNRGCNVIYKAGIYAAIQHDGYG